MSTSAFMTWQVMHQMVSSGTERKA